MSRFLFVVAASLFVIACDAVTPAAVEPAPVGPARAEYVLHVSIDGLRPDAITAQTPEALPAFARLRREGAFTDNARTDVDFRVTLPNHTSQLTGRPARGDDGHGWTLNSGPSGGVTLHSNRGEYVASVFDVAHDHGLRTGAYVSKSKFSLFDVSYNAEHGAPDTTGDDDGADKIDAFVYERDTNDLVERLADDLRAEPSAYTFVHLLDPDWVGHSAGWDLALGSDYQGAVRRADGMLGRLLDVIEADPRLAGRTALIVTSDHGGHGTNHAADVPEDFIVPFYVWGPGVTPGDLYDWNEGTRIEPGRGQISADGSRQPVRNGDAANLALAILGLPPVPGSTAGAADPLRLDPTVAP